MVWVDVFVHVFGVFMVSSNCQVPFDRISYSPMVLLITCSFLLLQASGVVLQQNQLFPEQRSWSLISTPIPILPAHKQPDQRNRFVVPVLKRPPLAYVSRRGEFKCNLCWCVENWNRLRRRVKWIVVSTGRSSCGPPPPKSNCFDVAVGLSNFLCENTKTKPKVR